MPQSQPQDTVTNDTTGADTLYYYSFELDSIAYGEHAFANGYGIFNADNSYSVLTDMLPKGGFAPDLL